jgi:hypothetical protein
MATGARRSSHLTVVDAIAQRHHFLASRPEERGKRRRRCTRILIRALRRFGASLHHRPGRSRRIRTCRELRRFRFPSRRRPCRQFGRSVREYRQKRRANRPAQPPGRWDDAPRPPASSPPPRNRRQIFRSVPDAWSPVKRLIHHVVAALLIWRAIPRTVERDEHAVTITRGKLGLVVEHHCVRRPMRGKCGHRSELVGANTHA